MTSLSHFYKAPSAVFLDFCKKDQLVEIARHYDIVLQEGILKDELKRFILSSLFRMGVLQKDPVVAAAGPESVVQAAMLTYEEQKELLQLQLELERERVRRWVK